MISAALLKFNQQNEITVVLVDGTGLEITGLGAGYSLEIAKSGGSFAAGAGVKSEIGDGHYRYILTAGECDTIGPISITAWGAGTVQNNLEYVVETRAIYAVTFTYTVTNNDTGLPIEGVQVWIATDIGGVNIVWSGVTDAFGAARDISGVLPRLDPGTYYVFRQKSGFTFNDPDTEVVA